MLELIKKLKEDIIKADGYIEAEEKELDSGEYNDYRECTDTIAHFEGRKELAQELIVILEKRLDETIDRVVTDQE